MSKFIDDKIEHIGSDIKKIQTKPSMYISHTGPKGAIHLCYELINNMIDECTNTNSPGDTVTIMLDENTNTITVKDNGRGIPEENIAIVCTALQSGSKFTREGTGGGSAGENGCGLTACNALSERFEIIVTRYGKKTSIGFTEGELTSPVTTKPIKDSTKHGTTFIMSPSRYYMGKDCDINSDVLIEWVDKISYLIPNHITINLSIQKRGKDSLVTKKFGRKGLPEYCMTLCQKGITEPLYGAWHTTMEEDIHGRTLNRNVRMEYAFTYDPNGVEFVVGSFCNYVSTIDHGVHVDAFKTALQQLLVKETKATLSEKEAKKIDIIPTDVLQGLVLTINLSTEYPPMFTSQTKHKVGNNDLFKPIRTMTYQELTNFFKNNPKLLKKVCDRVKLNAKARLESTKVRTSVIKGVKTSNLEEHLMENFEPCNNRGKNEYKELFIIEGRSAKGTSSEGRFDRDTQAIYSLRGVPLNAYGVRIDKVLANAELSNLVKILGCGIGPHFDLSKLKYNKIIIMADADSDGFNITSTMCAFFMSHLRPVVEAGYVYKAVSPLYELKDKENRFVRDKREYIKVFERNVQKVCILTHVDTDKKLSDEEVEQFLSINRPYLEELRETAEHLAIEPLLLEWLVMNRHNNTFYKDLKETFNELEYDDGVLTGVYDGKYQVLIMDKIFEKRVSIIDKYLNELNTFNKIHVREKCTDGLLDKGIMRIGEFMTMIQKFQPIIKVRFKGLGELDPEDLCETTLNPNNRVLIRLTTQDMERDLAIFDILHGKGNEDAMLRAQMMREVNVTRDDLDN